MPTPVGGQGSDYRTNNDTKGKSSMESRNQERLNNGNDSSMDMQSINDSTITMSLAGSISLDTKQYWECKECTLINVVGDLKCLACSSEKKQHIVSNFKKQFQDTWLCIKCTLVNDIHLQVCRACNEKRNNEVVANNSTRQNFGIKCNNGNNNIGKIPNEQLLKLQETFKPKNEMNMISTKGQVSLTNCPMCTYQNSASNKYCVACEINLTSLSVTEKSILNRATFDPQGNASVSTSRKSDIQRDKRKWDSIVQLCKYTTRTSFIDDEFPPSDKSLFIGTKMNTSVKSSILNSKRVTQWLRPNQIKSDTKNVDWTVFRTPLSSDISQGHLGNCWFLSALAVVAEKEDIIRNIIITKDFCEEGVYQIRLCKDGRWTTVLIDDYLPCDNRNRLVYSESKRKQLWVPLIEKAMAKLHGCYEALVSGRTIEGLLTLTGCPCETMHLQKVFFKFPEELDPNLIWVKLLSSSDAGFLMGASCGGIADMQVREVDIRNSGLLPNHAYSILDVKDINGLKLVRMRNPWGKTSWNGKWSDKSNAWTAALKKTLLPYGADDGVFWIEFNDVMRFFSSIDVCKVHKNWQETRLTGSFPSNVSKKDISVTLIRVFDPTEAEICLHQEVTRSERKRRDPLNASILLFKASHEGVPQYHNLTHYSKKYISNEGLVSCHALLDPGCYVILCIAFSHWNTKSNEDNVRCPLYTLALHSSKTVFVEKTISSKYTLADAMIHFTLSQGVQHQNTKELTTYYLKQGWAGLVVMIENRHHDRWVQVKCDCHESYNVVSTRGELCTADAVPPLHRQVIIVLTQLEGSGGFSIAHRLTHRLSLHPGLHDWGPEGSHHLPVLDSKMDGLHAPRPL